MGAYDSQKQSAHGVYARLQSLADRIVSADTRRSINDNIRTFSQENPLLASFLFVQAVLSFTPLALFVSFAAGTVSLALITALLFSLFWLGAALLVLIPTLFVTVSLALGLWAWAVASFVVARWAYNLIPVSVRGGVEVGMPNGKTVTVSKTGEGYGDVQASVEA